MCALERKREIKGEKRGIDLGSYQPVNLTYGEIQQPLIKIQKAKKY